MGLFDDACGTLSGAILILEEAGETEDVAHAKRALSEALFAAGHFAMSRSTNRDSILIYEFLGNTVEVKGCQLLEARLASYSGVNRPVFVPFLLAGRDNILGSSPRQVVGVDRADLV